jgi:hypothetical protein
MSDHVPLDPGNGSEFVSLTPDQMITHAQENEILSIVDIEGNLLFGLKGDGSVILPDPARVPEAAALFWTEVCRMADELGIVVVNPPMRGERNAQG